MRNVADRITAILAIMLAACAANAGDSFQLTVRAGAAHAAPAPSNAPPTTASEGPVRGGSMPGAKSGLRPAPFDGTPAQLEAKLAGIEIPRLCVSHRQTLPRIAALLETAGVTFDPDPDPLRRGVRIVCRDDGREPMPIYYSFDLTAFPLLHAIRTIAETVQAKCVIENGVVVLIPPRPGQRPGSRAGLVDGCCKRVFVRGPQDHGEPDEPASYTR
ncbi:MAG: hypothetical protein JXR37_04835 [Kiritimatiellae bacterium]|nr:hypothetical protein [Kiritimatiellia bacterium]